MTHKKHTPEETLTEEQKKLLSALFAGDIQTAQSLVNGGVDVNCATASGLTPLHLTAMVAGANELFFFDILSRTQNVNQPDARGMTALHYASFSVAKYKFSPKILTALVEKGADPNKLDHTSFSPLHMAAAATSKADQYNPDSAYQTLISLGAIETRTQGGYSSFDLFDMETQAHVTEMLSANGVVVTENSTDSTLSKNQRTA